MRIEADEHVLDVLFPAYIALNCELQVLDFGSSVRRRFPSLQRGEQISQFFRIDGPEGAATIEDATEQGLRLELTAHANGARLAGHALRSGTGFLLALRNIAESYALDQIDLEISDFAPGDPAVHGLLLYTLQCAVLEEQGQASRELGKERQKLADLLDRLSRVSGFIAHDFNNFLSIIKLNCDRLRHKVGGTSQLLHLIDIIQSTAERGTSITRSLMSISHQQEDARLSVPIDATILENLQFLATIVGTKISLALDLQASDLQSEVSPVAALNSLINLLVNARDAMPEGGQVTIKTRRVHIELQESGPTPGTPHDYIAVEIADAGGGMDANVLLHAFEPHFSTKPNGNGLGLASVRDFARSVGGDACLDSVPGEGTRVYLYLPITNALSRSPELADDSSMRNGGENRSARDAARKLLIVDDEPYALEALAELLEVDGYNVTTCNSAEQALQALSLESFDALLTDVIMPGESGAILARKASERRPGLKIMLMSGFVPQEETICRSLDLI